jgi:nitroimidazol reductase NimA-like FMN-containing flavoprotein (pyridoxamine 5'-phosphate oxidase superfamily)
LIGRAIGHGVARSHGWPQEHNGGVGCSASLSSPLLSFAANGIAMLGELTPEQMNALLFNEVVGRIGCHVGGRTYVVPITYVFDGDAVYGHSAEGLKIRMMRANPHVCFQVDQRENLANWRSVVAQGVYEELHGKEALDALQIFVTRMMPILTSETLSLAESPSPEAARPVPDAPKTVIFRIRLIEKSGRFEKR